MPEEVRTYTHSFMGLHCFPEAGLRIPVPVLICQMLQEKPQHAPQFFMFLIVSTILPGVVLNFLCA